MSFTYSRCLSVALVIQHAMRMRRIILSSLACPALSFSTLSHNGTVFRQKLVKLKCVLIFSTVVVSDMSHSKKNSGRYYHKCTEVFM